jgi:hypothetical protein
MYAQVFEDTTGFKWNMFRPCRFVTSTFIYKNGIRKSGNIVDVKRLVLQKFRDIPSGVCQRSENPGWTEKIAKGKIFK